jgi:hypothetical protein
MPEENGSDRKKYKPTEIIDEITHDLSKLRDDLAEGATLTGYALESFRGARQHWEDIESLSSDHPDKDTFIQASGESLAASRDEIRGVRVRASEVLRKIPSIASSSYVFTTSTDSSMSMLDIRTSLSAPPAPPPRLSREEPESYHDRFQRFDKDLGATYSAISEALYGTKSDPERAALFLMRQAFDHLFDKLAPDAQVRSSKFWHPKAGDNLNQVYRIERITFAAHKHIEDRSRRDSLIASTTYINQIYKSLNRAHKRGEVDKTKAVDALRAMESILKEWADALEF